MVVGRAKSRKDGLALRGMNRPHASAYPQAWRQRAVGALPPSALRRSGARADAAIESHGLSAFGDLAYPPDFAHFSYVDPHAPKGGIFSQIGPDQIYNQNFLTFNSLNTFILKGDAAQGMELTFATLMVRSGDEPDAMYGLAAAKVRRSADGLTYQFFIRPEAKFHDGSPLTAQDVAFSLTTLKEKGHPLISQSLRDFAGATADDDATVTVRFAPKRARDVPLFVAGLPIFSRAYYATRPFDESTLDIPLGSGAYQVGRFEPGRFIEYNRVKDWWGADLPVGRGQNNFDIVRFEYYRDRDVGFEGFSAGTYLFREEFTSRFWATRYDFPAVKDGRVKRDEIPDDTPSGAQGWFINTRRPQFADVRLRDALNDAFDFEWTNKTIMYNAYHANRFGVSELRYDGGRRAERRGACAARAVPRPPAGRSVRRALYAAGLGRLRRRPPAAAQGGADSCTMPAASSATASACCRAARRSPSNF